MRKLNTLLSLTVIVLLGFSSCKKKGCMDENASNYNPDAKKDDGSCVYTPTITLNGDATMTISVGSGYVDPGATAVDNEGTSIVVSTDSSMVNDSIVGSFTVTYSATNQHGTTTASRTVNVIINHENWPGSWTVSDDCGGGTSGIGLNSTPTIIVNGKKYSGKVDYKSFKKISKSHNLLVKSNDKLLDEVVNLVENPSVILADFNRDYLEIPKEIIISTLENHQRYFPCLNKNNEELTNLFVIVANKKDQNNVIKSGNKRVVEARLSDANFFWNRDKSKNLIKQIGNLKKIIFFDGLGNIYDKTQRLRKLGGWLSDELNISKEKVEIAASISKSDLCSELVGEFPDLQGVMGKYFALSQGFEQDVARAISDHYQPVNINSNIPKRPISYSISIVDKIDNLTGFFLINQKPTSSKDPLALRRSAIGLLKTIIHNKLNLKLGNLINLNIRLFEEQGTKIINKLAEKEIIDFLRERMKNILKEKNIKPDIIEASISSHRGDNFFELFNKSILMNKFINKDIGINAINSYKRAFNIIDKIDKEIDGRPDAVLFRKDEEKALFNKINEIRKSLTVKDDHKDFEKLLKNFSETKILTDNFFDKVKVNDDNDDIKNNRLHLLKMFCNTFNSFINFSKLEGVS